ncbi:hypothetical protein B0H11DRAFT_2132669, partial [Mycena galericulata]
MSRIFPHEWLPSRAGAGAAFNWRQASGIWIFSSTHGSMKVLLLFPKSTPTLLLLPRIKFGGLRSFGICSQCRARHLQENQPESDKPSVRNKSSPGEAFSTEACIHFGKKKDRRRPLMDDPTWFDSPSAVIHAQKTGFRLAGGLCSAGGLCLAGDLTT